LAFQLLIVEVEKLVALGGAGHHGMQRHLLKGLGNGVEVDGAKRLDGGGEPTLALPPR
jgi:hypothetical protein